MKIIQIIPAPTDMLAHFKNHDKDALRDKNGRAVAKHVPVCCLALVEYEEGECEVRPMIVTQYGLEFADDDIDSFLFMTQG